MFHKYSLKKKCVLHKNYYITRCEKKRYSNGDDVLLVFNMVIGVKMADIIMVNELLPYVAMHLWSGGKCNHNELAKFRQRLG
jgi:hypothetical protein